MALFKESNVTDLFSPARFGAADAIAFGRLLLAKPDLVERFRRGAPLNAPDYEKLYSVEEKGYTDSPCLPDLSALYRYRAAHILL